MRRTTAVYAALAATDVLLAGLGRERARRLSKPLLMPALALDVDGPTRRALALSAAGDVALLGSSDAAFTAGLSSFLGAHVAWIAALRGRSSGRLRRRPVLALPHVAAYLALNAVLWRRTGRDRVPVVAYSTALLAMSLAALDTDDPSAAAGGALFLVSDTLLALERFAGVQLPAHEGWVMASYTAAQGLLAAQGRR